MNTIKEQLLIAIESAPEPILEQALDYLEYLKTRSHQALIPEGEPIRRGSKAKDLLEFAGTWHGKDAEECLQLVYETRSPADF
jgi:hypothetical protein